MFFSQPGISTEQVGQFLGEDFSLSQTLRLEFVNSLRLLGTGVVSCLAKVFKAFVMPTELLKIDRLVDGIAQIWWRQHEQLAKKEGEATAMYRGGVGEEGAEVQGLELMHAAGSYDVLHQLMFSTVLLHWNLYAPLPRSQRVTTEQWLQIGSGISPELEEGDRKSRLSAMTRIQSLIYNVGTSADIVTCLESRVQTNGSLEEERVLRPRLSLTTFIPSWRCGKSAFQQTLPRPS